MTTIRLCRADEGAAILSIINAAAEVYRDVIPTDQWHEPYMPRDELDREIAAGVTFWGFENNGVLTGVMGLQSMRDVDLIRHAYVLPAQQRHGIGGKTPPSSSADEHTADAGRHLGRGGMGDPLLRAPQLPVGFAHSQDRAPQDLLDIPDRQIETSVVLANPPEDGVA